MSTQIPDDDDDNSSNSATDYESAPAISASSSGSGGGGGSVSKDDGAEYRTPESRRHVREKVNADIEAFLASGGKIQMIEPNVQADPPTKPSSSYGSRPI